MDHYLQRWRQKVIGRGEDDSCECRDPERCLPKDVAAGGGLEGEDRVGGMRGPGLVKGGGKFYCVSHMCILGVREQSPALGRHKLHGGAVSRHPLDLNANASP